MGGNSNLSVEFEKLVRYDSNKTGISIIVELRSGKDVVIFDAKVDTGLTYCIFERQQADRLGIEIDTGLHERIATTTRRPPCQ